MMHGREKSDPAIVATKPPNEARTGAEEAGEPRAGAKGKADQQSTRRALNRESVSQALDRLRQAARQRKKERFTALLHHINLDLLRMAFLDLKRTAAPGVDGLTWQDYEADLEPRLRDLHDRVHRGACRALPSRRRYIPKADGRARPLAIAALEDKIVQRATVAVLNAIYEEDFLGRDLRGGLPRVQLWVSAQAQPARCAGCSGGRHLQHQGELHLGRRHPIVLRRREPDLAYPLPEPPDRRPAHHPLDPEMAQGGCPGRRGRDHQ